MDITNELIRQRNLTQIKRIIRTRNEVYQDEFNYAKNKIPFNNGVYDLENDEFRDFEKSDNFTFKFDVEYVEDPENNSVDEFLHTIQDTEEKVRKLKETAGLALLPHHPIDKAVVAYGQGGNGKNMFVKIVDKVLGSAAHKIDIKQLTGDKFAMGELEDKTFVFFDEFGSIGDPDKLKTLIGDDQIRVRPFGSAGYLTEQRAFPFFAANEMPQAPEQNPGFFRRWEIIDFPYRFTSDPTDGHKNKVPQQELEEKYMSPEALNAFASRAVEHLKNVLESEDFTNGQSPHETRVRWNKKSSPLFSFINNFIEQGKIPDYSTDGEADYIPKKKLLELVNDYARQLNSTPVRMHELTAAIEKSPDLELGTEGRIETQSGTEQRAYAGIKLTLPNFHNSQGSQDLLEISNQHMAEFEKYGDVKGVRSAQMLVIVETGLHLKTLRYLQSCEDCSASLLELIRALKLTESEIDELHDCDFIDVDQNTGSDSAFPQIVFDRESFDKAVEESGELTGAMGNLKRPVDWLQDECESWSRDTEMDTQDLVEKAKAEGFGEEKVEQAIDDLIDDGILFEPKPGKVSAV